MTTPRKVAGLPIHDHPRPHWDDYRLRVDGLVARPLSLSEAELRAMPQRAFDADFVCLAGWVAPEQHWSGVPLAEVLALAGAEGRANWVQASAADFSWPMPVPEAVNALLALDLGDEPIAPEHGAPVRLLVAGGECFTSIKWLEHLELCARPMANTAERIARARLEVDRPPD